MKLYAVKIRLVEVGDNIADVILEALRQQNLWIGNSDIIALTS